MRGTLLNVYAWLSRHISSFQWPSFLRQARRLHERDIKSFLFTSPISLEKDILINIQEHYVEYEY